MHINRRSGSAESFDSFDSAHADAIDGSLKPCLWEAAPRGELKPRKCLSCENLCVDRYLWVILRKISTFFHHNGHKSRFMGATD